MSCKGLPTFSGFSMKLIFTSKNPVSLQVMHECWFENTLARLSALRIKKNLTEIQVLWWKMIVVVAPYSI